MKNVRDGSRGNQKDEGGLVYLTKYLEMDHVKGQISKEERAYVQINPNNNKVGY